MTHHNVEKMKIFFKNPYYTLHVLTCICWKKVHLNAVPQLFVGHLHPPEVVLYLSSSLDVLLHAFNILHRGPQNSAFIPAYIPEHKRFQMVKCLLKFPFKSSQKVHICTDLRVQTYRSLVLGIMVPSSLIRSLMLNLLLLSTKRKTSQCFKLEDE